MPCGLGGRGHLSLSSSRSPCIGPGRSTQPPAPGLQCHVPSALRLWSPPLWAPMHPCFVPFCSSCPLPGPVPRTKSSETVGTTQWVSGCRAAGDWARRMSSNGSWVALLGRDPGAEYTWGCQTAAPSAVRALSCHWWAANGLGPNTYEPGVVHTSTDGWAGGWVGAACRSTGTPHMHVLGCRYGDVRQVFLHFASARRPTHSVYRSSGSTSNALA